MTELMIHSITVVYLEDNKRAQTSKHSYSYISSGGVKLSPRPFSFKHVKELRAFAFQQMLVETKRKSIVKVKTTKGQYFFVTGGVK